MKIFSRKATATLLLMLSFLTVYSCGSDDDNDDDETPQEQQQQQEQSFGDFQAITQPVNPNVINTITSNNRVTITADTVRVLNQVRRGPRNTTIRQNIYGITACPTIADDSNGDGFVDGVEAQNRTGGILIPLDSDISTQVGGGNTYPRTNAAGNYTYVERGSLAGMVADLTAPDPNPGDQIAKLNPGDGINMNGAILQLQGVPANVTLPATVAGLPGLTPHQSLPIACGRFQQVAAEPTPPAPIPPAVSCVQELAILCPEGQVDGCSTGQTRVHQCVIPRERSCRQDIAIICAPGQVDGCTTGQTTVHRCVTPAPVACTVDVAILCPTGFHDGCETGTTTTHTCVRDEEPVACTTPLEILCPTGQHDGCTDGRTETHQCIEDTPTP